MSKKIAIIAGVGAMGCFGMIFVGVLLVGGIVAVASMDGQPQTQEDTRGQGGQQGGNQGGQQQEQQEEQQQGGEETGATLTVEGQIVDSQSGEGIPGTIVLLLTPGTTAEQFVNAGEDEKKQLMEAGAKTDGSGRYSIGEVRRGNTYTLLFAADGYEFGYIDNGLEITGQDPNPTQLKPIGLNRE